MKQRPVELPAVRQKLLFNFCLGAKNLRFRFQKLFRQKLCKVTLLPQLQVQFAVFPASNGACTRGEISVPEAEAAIYCKLPPLI